MLQIVLYTLGGFALVMIDLVLLPGAILAVIGSCAILYAIYLTGTEYGLLPALIHFLAALAVVPKLVTWSLGRVSLKGEMKQEDGYTGVPDRGAYLGLNGRALSPLRPSGTVVVEVDGRRVHLDCVSESGFVDAGQSVLVVEERGPSLVVRALAEQPDAAAH